MTTYAVAKKQSIKVDPQQQLGNAFMAGNRLQALSNCIVVSIDWEKGENAKINPPFSLSFVIFYSRRQNKPSLSNSFFQLVVASFSSNQIKSNQIKWGICGAQHTEEQRHIATIQEAQLSLTNRAMPVCKVVKVLQDFLSEYVDKKFTRDYTVWFCTYLSSIVSELHDA